MEKKYFKRNIDKLLLNWVNSSNRKPILLRGARQVGKSASVKNLAKNFKYFINVNFEEYKEAHKIFEGDLNPKEICNNLSLFFNTPIIPGETLLFFDEIQSCIPAISSLRFFYEDYNEIHLIAAGSLLEFALEELHSFGVGRIRTIFIYPFSFDEFLSAIGETILLDAKNKSSLSNPLSDLIHNKLLQLYKKYLLLGGMPEVISNYIQSENMHLALQILDDLITTFRADFTKYKKRVPSARLLEVFTSVTQQMGNKFVYTKADTDSNHKQIKEALSLLIMAGLVIPVTHSSSNGIPLGAEINIRKRKMLIFDTGIFQRLLGLDISNMLLDDDFNLINKGAIVELSIGLEILKYMPANIQQDLYYWHRESISGNAEVDYVIQSNQNIIPVEVKSGSRGSMKSIFQFLKEKNSNTGIRFSTENYSSYDNIKVYPVYAVSNFIREFILK